MEFKKQIDKAGGWTIDIGLLSSISNHINDESTLSLEEIEEVLLALEKSSIHVIFSDSDKDN